MEHVLRLVLCPPALVPPHVNNLVCLKNLLLRRDRGRQSRRSQWRGGASSLCCVTPRHAAAAPSELWRQLWAPRGKAQQRNPHNPILIVENKQVGSDGNYSAKDFMYSVKYSSGQDVFPNIAFQTTISRCLTLSDDTGKIKWASV